MQKSRELERRRRFAGSCRAIRSRRSSAATRRARAMRSLENLPRGSKLTSKDTLGGACRERKMQQVGVYTREAGRSGSNL
jgi:hypothetical protein